MYRQILVPVDGSPLAEAVLPYARGIAAAIGAKLKLVKVTEDAGENWRDEAYLKNLSGKAQAYAELLPSKGDVAKAILNELSELPDALLATTTHGRTGLAEVVLGSVARRLVQEAGRPVLLYRPQHPADGASASPISITSIVVPLDGSYFAETMIPHAVELAMSLKARLEFIQAVHPETHSPGTMPPQRDYVESSYARGVAEETRRTTGLEASWDVLHGHAADAITEYVRSRPNSMLAMSTHGRSGILASVMGSVTSECLRRTHAPVLVYRPEGQS